MPAVSPSPLLRRQLSEEARRLLFQALTHGSVDGASPLGPSASRLLPDVLRNIRCKVKLEIPEVGVTPSAALAIHGSDIRVEFLSSGDDVELVILNKSGCTCKWVAHKDGRLQQYREYALSLNPESDEYKKLTSFVEISEMFDIYAAVTRSPSARRVTEKKSHRIRGLQFVTYITDFDQGKRFIYMLDPQTGSPARIRQEYEPSPDPDAVRFVTLHLEDCRPSTGKPLEIPLGMKTDMQVTVDAAMEFFAKWEMEHKTAIYQVFKAMDTDGDGFITAEDMIHALRSAGQREENALHLTREMIKLLTNADDPAEEFNFHRWCGFWLVMLADGHGVSHVDDQKQMVTAFRQLFHGEIYYQDPALH